MILHRITAAELLRRIDAHDPKWRAAAKKKSRAVLKKGRIDEGDGTWSAIKDVFIALQGNKCMYCEKPMPAPSAEAVAKGRVEYDVEHHRPKNRVSPWPTPAVLAARRITYAKKLRSGAPEGYLHLAFDPENYGVSCKTCNSELKGDRFPIVGKCSPKAKTRAAHDACELPCVVLPIGDAAAVDPEKWLVWAGPFVRAFRSRDETRRLRARALVDFFELDAREDLVLLRCFVIDGLYRRLSKRPRSLRDQRYIDARCASTSAFAGCARGFCKLYERDPKGARTWALLAEKKLSSAEPSVFCAKSSATAR